MSLLPEKPLIISPSLAATIGLEETVLLQLLNELMCHGKPERQGDYDWLNIDSGQLQKFAPFWSLPDLQRVVGSLRDKGILLVASPPLTEANLLRFAFNEQCADNSHTAKPGKFPATLPATPTHQSTRPISPDWRPENDVLQQLAQYNIPAAFIADQLPEFITYWTERGEPRYSWGSKFIKHVLRLWRAQQTETARRGQDTPMSRDWQPSQDAMEILTRQAAINRNFVEDAIPEFVLYWLERGESSSTWNSRFIMHVKRQWARFTHTMEQDTMPRPLAADWQPREELFEVLTLANIPRDFAERLVPEFVLYWRDSGQLYGSWNTKFLQQVKREWSRHQTHTQDSSDGKQQRSDRPGSTRSRTLVDELSDRSWATS
ncbi:DnaT-like ssDNA-binding domain-containing protein [Porticoccus sp.]|uniref:DnaT-like ssDNA-binding domain-containing protein n=1 Tax=Porticoccus sp. TaxID=2024853 RepID=UPI003F69A827